jgi:oxygen-independent coproporphyrinogen-3 oxidase
MSATNTVGDSRRGLLLPEDDTTVGNYFVANYPPFAFWRKDATGDLDAALDRSPSPGNAMGVYTHIPFCRKRCHFCYFKVYTDKNASQISGYLDALVAELRMLRDREAFGERTPTFVYFGGGTPSYLSAAQFGELSSAMQSIVTWDDAQEITLEAEPGTLNAKKLAAIRAMGVTRLSLGIEHFDDHVLEINGRAHRSKEIVRAFGEARAAGFPEINVDLIAGMVEETDERWYETVRKTIDLAPDTVTIYQMEVPYNTEIYKRMERDGVLVAPVADWATKRRWVAEAFAEFEKAGYAVTSATTAVKSPERNRFVYRQNLFGGSDVFSIGVSSFGYINGVNYQNEHEFGRYIETVSSGHLPTYRTYALSHDERYIREFALQLKGGSVEVAPFLAKFGTDPRVQFAEALERIGNEGYLERVDDERVVLTQEALMRVDRLLFEFFRPEHYTRRFS